MTFSFSSPCGVISTSYFLFGSLSGSMIQPSSHLLPPTGRTLPMIWKLQPSLAFLGSLNQTRRPHSLPLQSVISTAPRPVWSIQMPSGLPAANAGVAVDARVMGSARATRLRTAIMNLAPRSLLDGGPLMGARLRGGVQRIDHGGCSHRHKAG